MVRQPSSSPDPGGVNIAFAGTASGIVLWDGLVAGAADPTLNARTGLGMNEPRQTLPRPARGGIVRTEQAGIIAPDLPDGAHHAPPYALASPTMGR